MKIFSRLFLVVALLSVAAGMALPAMPTSALGNSMLQELFRKDTASGWTISGDAKLTSNSEDASGQGWLRLTPAENGKAGSAIYNTAFSSSKGLNITFDYAIWGGNGADGFTVYLIDGTTATPTVGAPGAALGYAGFKYDVDEVPGVTNGYLGIGFDVYGNFMNSDLLNGGASGTTPGITVRGPGNLLDAGSFPFLTNYATYSIETGSRTNVKTVSILLTPPPVNPGDPNQTLTVILDGNTVINNFAISNEQYPMPATFKIGFSASTGGLNNYHEIRDLAVSGINTTTLDFTNDFNPASPTITLTASIACNDRLSPYGPIQPTGTVTFFDGETELGTATITGNPTAVGTLTLPMLTLGLHSLTALYSGDQDCASTNLFRYLTVTEPEIPVVKKPAEPQLPKTGFAPGIVTTLPKQPKQAAYQAYGDLTLEIPTLKAKMPIVGVPKTDNSWDVAYLGRSAGYLNGTAFPTWVGNSVITAHVWDANNQPGPFANLKGLKYGDVVKINAFGSVYTYEVRESRLIWPSQSNVALAHKEDHSWITLLTCEDYSALWDTYSFRRMVRAVLVSVE